MRVLDNYTTFEGRHWHTGAVHNVLTHQGTPISEAMLLGISGGIRTGYFTFSAEGCDPAVVILTRNTFRPIDTLCERLHIPVVVRETASPARSVSYLLEALEQGKSAVVWADIYSLPYNHLHRNTGTWLMQPVVVYGYEDDVYLADRSQNPLLITPEELAAARSPGWKSSHKLLTLGEPDMRQLPDAIKTGIADCIRGFKEGITRQGTKGRIGFDGLKKWSAMLTDTRKKENWSQLFPPGAAMYAGLTSAFTHIALWGSGRDMYADFLDEASSAIKKPALKDAAGKFRNSAAAWQKLEVMLLPEYTAPLKETRELLLRKKELFIQQGQSADDELRDITQKIDDLKTRITANFPLSSAEAAILREQISIQLLDILDSEQAAVSALETALN